MIPQMPTVQLTRLQAAHMAAALVLAAKVSATVPELASGRRMAFIEPGDRLTRAINDAKEAGTDQVPVRADDLDRALEAWDEVCVPAKLDQQPGTWQQVQQVREAFAVVYDDYRAYIRHVADRDFPRPGGWYTGPPAPVYDLCPLPMNDGLMDLPPLRLPQQPDREDPPQQ